MILSTTFVEKKIAINLPLKAGVVDRCNETVQGPGPSFGIRSIFHGMGIFIMRHIYVDTPPIAEHPNPVLEFGGQFVNGEVSFVLLWWLLNPNLQIRKSRDYVYTLQWRHNESHDVTDHQPHDCLLKRLFRGRSKKTSKFCVTGLSEGNSPMTGEFPAQRASNAENASIWWLHHENMAVKGTYHKKSFEKWYFQTKMI